MATKRCGMGELVRTLVRLAKPITDAWRAEGRPGWWARARAWMTRKLRGLADRLSKAAEILADNPGVFGECPALRPFLASGAVSVFPGERGGVPASSRTSRQVRATQRHRGLQTPPGA